MASDTAYPRTPLEQGLTLYRQGQITDALQYFFLAAGDDPTDPAGHYLSGLALQALGLTQAACIEWQEVLILTREHGARVRAQHADLDSRWLHDRALSFLRQSALSERTGPQ